MGTGPGKTGVNCDGEGMHPREWASGEDSEKGS
jgi:hypothetical protein